MGAFASLMVIAVVVIPVIGLIIAAPIEQRLIDRDLRELREFDGE